MDSSVGYFKLAHLCELVKSIKIVDALSPFNTQRINIFEEFIEGSNDILRDCNMEITDTRTIFNIEDVVKFIKTQIEPEINLIIKICIELNSPIAKDVIKLLEGFMISLNNVESRAGTPINARRTFPSPKSGSSSEIGDICINSSQNSPQTSGSSDVPFEYSVAVSNVCKTIYEEIKEDKKHRYVIFYIRDEKQIDVEVIGNRAAEYDSFLNDIQKGGDAECRYGLFDFEYVQQCQGGSKTSKKQHLILLLWSPVSAKDEMKMLYTSSYDALKKSFVGVEKYIEATNLSEVSREAVEEKLRATDSH